MKLPTAERLHSAQTKYRHRKADEKRAQVEDTAVAAREAANPHGSAAQGAHSPRRHEEHLGSAPRTSDPSNDPSDLFDYDYLGPGLHDDFDDFGDTLGGPQADDSGYLSDHRSQLFPGRPSTPATRDPTARSPTASPSPRLRTPDPRPPPPQDSEEDAAERARLLAENEADELAPAFRETLAVRLAYLESVLGHVYSHQTLEASQRVLRTALKIASLYELLPTHPKPATTVPTAARRLGINVDDYIRRIPICDACFKPYTLAEINNLDSPRCVGKGCKDSVVYKVTGKRARAPGDDGECGDVEVRVPKKIQPYNSIIGGLRRMLLRSDFVNNLVNMDAYVNRPPRPSDEPMRDIHDGTRFGQLSMGMKRVLNPDGTISEVEVQPGSKRKLAECELGLSGTLNIDW